MADAKTGPPMVIALFTAYDFSKGARENTPTTTETTDLGVATTMVVVVSAA